MCFKKKNNNCKPATNNESKDVRIKNIPIELESKINRLLAKVENKETVILIEDASEIDSLKSIASKGIFGVVNEDLNSNLTVLSEMIDCCLNLKQQYTTMFDDMSRMILKTGELMLFMKMNALNEAAIISDSGPRHFLFNTDWKETIWRKKIVKAAGRYLDYGDKAYLDKTVSYITMMMNFSLSSPPSLLKSECENVIKSNNSLCQKFNLDNSTIENTNNPFDKF